MNHSHVESDSMTGASGEAGLHCPQPRGHEYQRVSQGHDASHAESRHHLRPHGAGGTDARIHLLLPADGSDAAANGNDSVLEPSGLHATATAHSASTGPTIGTTPSYTSTSSSAPWKPPQRRTTGGTCSPHCRPLARPTLRLRRRTLVGAGSRLVRPWLSLMALTLKGIRCSLVAARNPRSLKMFCIGYRALL